VVSYIRNEPAVTNPCFNQARRRTTSFINTKALTTPNGYLLSLPSQPVQHASSHNAFITVDRITGLAPSPFVSDVLSQKEGKENS